MHGKDKIENAEKEKHEKHGRFLLKASRLSSRATRQFQCS